MKTYSPKISKILKRNNRNTPSGTFGRYFKISKYRGIKILHERHDSIKEAEMSEDFENAEREEQNLIRARKRIDFVPRCYGVKIVKYNKDFCVGIILQHLGNITLKKFERENENYDSGTLTMIDKKLRKAKIYYSDLHSENIMYHNKKWYVIDFGIVNYDNPIKFK